MTLEEIIETYGWIDYFDQNTGYIYLLSEVPIPDRKYNNKCRCRVKDIYGAIVGSCKIFE